MTDKTFRTFDDVEPDDLIGGSARMARQKVPSDLGSVPGLVNPAEPAHVDAFRAEIQGRDLVLEVGPGKGAFLVAKALADKDSFCVGFESRLAFCLTTLTRAGRAGCGNLRVVWGDARAAVPLLIEPESAGQAYLLFPDPWWKKKHARRRHGPVMARALGRALAPGGLMVLKSDVGEYLDGLRDVFIDTGLFVPGRVPDGLPLTNREVGITRNMEKVFAAALTKK
ncbi:MAG: hypothetical protein GXP54_10285 [Deltaproteobacteria bacterium]|nr:hypothetical protein [Deltaproteobacteria bacterium]